MKHRPANALLQAVGRAAVTVILFVIFGSNAQGKTIATFPLCDSGIQGCFEQVDCPKGSQCVEHDSCEFKGCIPTALVCEKDTECGPCMECDDGVCSAPQQVDCVNDFYCNPGTVCSFCGECVPKDDPCAFAQPECLNDGQCAPGMECTQELECGTGICTPLPKPEPECEEDPDCGPCGLCDSGVCGTLDFGMCLGDSDCPEHHGCGECGECVFVPECAMDEDCGICEGCFDGICTLQQAPVCELDSECGDADSFCNPCGQCAPIVCETDQDCSSPCAGACVNGSCGVGTCPEPTEPEPTEPEPTEPEPTDPPKADDPNDLSRLGDLPAEPIQLATGSGKQGGCTQNRSELPVFGIVLLGLLAALSVARRERQRREERIPVRIRKGDIHDRV